MVLEFWRESYRRFYREEYFLFFFSDDYPKYRYFDTQKINEEPQWKWRNEMFKGVEFLSFFFVRK